MSLARKLSWLGTGFGGKERRRTWPCLSETRLPDRVSHRRRQLEAAACGAGNLCVYARIIVVSSAGRGAGIRTARRIYPAQARVTEPDASATGSGQEEERGGQAVREQECATRSSSRRKPGRRKEWSLWRTGEEPGGAASDFSEIEGTLPLMRVKRYRF